ncbi:hypothetical protein AB7Z60_18870, partial [Proteus mirabilis]|uniref:hypothetical protein n=1 Tax=Proteus mirabilis TaxID=584 RepID=UPI0034E48E2F
RIKKDNNIIKLSYFYLSHVIPSYPKSNDNNLLQMLIKKQSYPKNKKSGIRNRGVWDKLT